MDEGRVELARTSGTINAPMADVWAVLTDFAHPQRLASTIDRCTVSGDGVGAVRTVESSRGLVIHERLLECDAAAGRFRYEILESGDMPFAHVLSYECTVTVSGDPAGSTTLDWSSVGLVDGPLAPIEAFLGALYRRATDSIRAAVSPPA